MSIEVRVSTSFSPLWTCIKVLTEHILCTKLLSLFEIKFCVVSLSLSLTHSIAEPL